MINYQWKPEHECSSQDRSPYAGYATNDDSGNELDGERKVPVGGYDVASIRGEKSTRDASQERRQDEGAHFCFKEVDPHNCRAHFVIAHSHEGTPGA